MVVLTICQLHHWKSDLKLPGSAGRDFHLLFWVCLFYSVKKLYDLILWLAFILTSKDLVKSSTKQVSPPSKVNQENHSPKNLFAPKENLVDLDQTQETKPILLGGSELGSVSSELLFLSCSYAEALNILATRDSTSTLSPSLSPSHDFFPSPLTLPPLNPIFAEATVQSHQNIVNGTKKINTSGLEWTSSKWYDEMMVTYQEEESGKHIKLSKTSPHVTDQSTPSTSPLQTSSSLFLPSPLGPTRLGSSLDPLKPPSPPITQFGHKRLANHFRLPKDLELKTAPNEKWFGTWFLERIIGTVHCLESSLVELSNFVTLMKFLWKLAEYTFIFQPLLSRSGSLHFSPSLSFLSSSPDQPPNESPIHPIDSILKGDGRQPELAFPLTDSLNDNLNTTNRTISQATPPKKFKFLTTLTLGLLTCFGFHSQISIGNRDSNLQVLFFFLPRLGTFKFLLPSHRLPLSGHVRTFRLVTPNPLILLFPGCKKITHSFTPFLSFLLYRIPKFL